MLAYAQGSASSGISSFQSSPSQSDSAEDADAISDAPLPLPGKVTGLLEAPKPRNRSQLGPKKGHKKSHGGCFHCKRRKIKCQETLPSCVNCLRRSLECKYPEVKSSEVDVMTAVRERIPRPTAALQSTPTLFTLDDMRLYQHFIFNAYPHLPLNNAQVWMRTVPAFAHNYDYLMHAMLALAATHLTDVTNANYTELALSHRLRAIHGFNKALSTKIEKEPDGDALLATIYSLTFQSAFMKDSMVEFLTMVRGCVILSNQLKSQSLITAFNIDWDTHLRYMEPRLVDLPSIDPSFTKEATKSLEALNFVFEDEINSFYYHQLVNIVDGIKASLKLGYWRLVSIYDVIGMMSDSKFTAFASSSNTIGQILLAHFMALEMLLLPLLEREYEKVFPRNQLISRFSWFEAIEKSVPPAFQAFIQWPGGVLKVAREEWETELTGFKAILAKGT